MEVREPSAKYLARTAFKQTDVGLIPGDWSVSTIGDLASTSSGTTPPRAQANKYFENGSIPWVKTLDLNNGSIVSTDETITPAALSETSLQLYPNGSVLVAMYGGYNQIGRTGILEISATVNQALTAIRPDTKRLHPGYLLRVLNHRIDYWRTVASSSRKDPNITSKDIREFPLAVPPIPEQQAIAEALSDADALIESLEQLLAKKRQIKQGAMQELLTGQKRLPGFAGEWQPTPLGAIGEFLKGSGITRDEAQSGTLPCVRYGEIYTTHNDYIRAFQSWISLEVAVRATRLRQGDVLFAGSGETKEEIGKCIAFVDKLEAYAGGDIVILRPRGFDSLFLGYALNTANVIRQKASRGQGDAVVHISAVALAQIEVRVPDATEQTAIATLLSDMDTELAALEAKLAKARDLKQGMMQELLTGRIRLV
ncbi:MAG: restriction endonuclease subunit S [Sulfuritalea sp.]|nr:restriction endonuclease subunit S [Sulfuritalea sp.]